MNILLHICCGVCAAGVVDKLMKEGHSVTGFFFNPNIYPEDEYDRRLETVHEVSRRMGFPVIEGEYDTKNWYRLIKCFENDPEGGRRCEICFCVRLEETYKVFLEGNFDVFTTTLTVSPLKNAEAINSIGRNLAGDKFMAEDFKKKEGYKIAAGKAGEMGLYRQNYCGCEYSRRK